MAHAAAASDDPLHTRPPPRTSPSPPAQAQTQPPLKPTKTRTRHTPPPLHTSPHKLSRRLRPRRRRRPNHVHSTRRRRRQWPRTVVVPAVQTRLARVFAKGCCLSGEASRFIGGSIVSEHHRSTRLGQGKHRGAHAVHPRGRTSVSHAGVPYGLVDAAVARTAGRRVALRVLGSASGCCSRKDRA